MYLVGLRQGGEEGFKSYKRAEWKMNRFKNGLTECRSRNLCVVQGCGSPIATFRLHLAGDLVQQCLEHWILQSSVHGNLGIYANLTKTVGVSDF